MVFGRVYSRGVGFVHFVNVEDADKAIQTLNNTAFGDAQKEITVKYATQKKPIGGGGGFDGPPRGGFRGGGNFGGRGGGFRGRGRGDFGGGRGGGRIPCRFFLTNSCTKGDDCTFAHP